MSEMTATEIAGAILGGRMWQECVCGCTIYEDETVGTDENGDDVCRQTRIVISKSIDDYVFCSRQCRLDEERRLQKAEHRRRRIAGMIFKRFGKAKFGPYGYIWGAARSGWCKCDRTKMGEYPGSFCCKLEGLKYQISGCIWCGQYGVSKIDVDAFQALCKQRGIDLVSQKNG
jgi:hypothetical protein